MKRKASITRKTKETKIDVELNIDGKGQYKIDTGIGFLDHMLEQLSKHSSIDLKQHWNPHFKIKVANMGLF